MALKQIENFDRQLVFVHGHGIERHQVGHQAFADLRVGLKISHKIAVRKNAE